MSLRHSLLLAVAFAVVPIAAQGQSPETVIYYHTDAIGSVRMTTDANGQVIGRYDFSPFGEPWAAPPTPDPRQFAGQERDADTGFDYFGARYYQNVTARFTSVDPGHVNGDVFDPQSWNGYAYALNNPLRFVDPHGTCSQDANGNYVDGDDAGTLVAPGPCSRGKGGALTIGVTETVSVKSKSALVALAEGISYGAGPVAEPLVVVEFYGASALGGLALWGGGALAGQGLISLAAESPLVPSATALVKFAQETWRRIPIDQRRVAMDWLSTIRPGSPQPSPLPVGANVEALKAYRELALRLIRANNDPVGTQRLRVDAINKALGF